MKTLTLTQGYEALIDDEDSDKVNQYSWYAHVKEGNTVYVRSSPTYKGPILILHRFILNITDDNIEIDHRDRNGLNNQKYNLRICTHRQNCCNFEQPKTLNAVSQYRGVTRANKDKFQARIRTEEGRLYLGSFFSDIDAAVAYDKAAVKYQGEFATLNFPDNINEYLKELQNG